MRLIAGSVCFALCVLAFGGCDAQSEGGPTSLLPTGGNGSGSPDANVECCPISPQPDCEMQYGGTKTSVSSCGFVADGMVLPDAAWQRTINQDGCPYWVEPEPRGSWDCCGCPAAPNGPDATPAVTLPEAGACEPPQGWYYDTAGCDELPKCRGPEFDACASEACSCDGETMGGCGFFYKPIAHFGPCTDAADSGPDGG